MQEKDRENNNKNSSNYTSSLDCNKNMCITRMVIDVGAHQQYKSSLPVAVNIMMDATYFSKEKKVKQKGISVLHVTIH